MADAPYLVALALVESGGKRSLPLTGKSWSGASDAADPGETGRALALELLLRLWQRTDGAPLQRAAGDDSLLLLELPLQPMSEQLPVIKAAWTSGGGTDALLRGLKDLAIRGWRIPFARHEGIRFIAWP